jgi:hypothetical protein
MLGMLDVGLGSLAALFINNTRTAASGGNPAVQDHGSIRKREESRHVAISKM